MRDASHEPDRNEFTCPVCKRLITTAIDGLFTNPAVGSPRRFCTPGCRQAAYRRRRAGIEETTHSNIAAAAVEASTPTNHPTPAPSPNNHP